MTSVLAQLTSVILPFLIGYALKRTRLVTLADGHALLRILFLVGLPVLTFDTVRRANLTTDSTLLALVPVFLFATSLLLVRLVYKARFFSAVDTSTLPITLAGTLLMNTAFLIPFVDQFYGEDGLARLLIVDTVNGVLIVSIIYAVLLRSTRKQAKYKEIAYNIGSYLTLWALALAVVFRVNNWGLTGFTEATLSVITGIVPVIVFITFGILFKVQLKHWKTTTITVIARYAASLATGLVFVFLFGLNGLDAQIALVVALAPVGFNTVLFAKQQNLSKARAESYVSISILLSLALIPATILILQRVFS